MFYDDFNSSNANYSDTSNQAVQAANESSKVGHLAHEIAQRTSEDSEKNNPKK